jgi:hypothetical protein
VGSLNNLADIRHRVQVGLILQSLLGCADDDTVSAAGKRNKADADDGADAAPARTPTKILVFAHHRAVLDQLQRMLEGADAAFKALVGYVRIDGEDPPKLRHERQLAFHHDSTKQARAAA